MGKNKNSFAFAKKANCLTTLRTKVPSVSELEKMLSNLGLSWDRLVWSYESGWLIVGLYRRMGHIKGLLNTLSSKKDSAEFFHISIVKNWDYMVHLIKKSQTNCCQK